LFEEPDLLFSDLKGFFAAHFPAIVDEQCRPGERRRHKPWPVAAIVKRFLSVLTWALRRARHFALVEKVPYPDLEEAKGVA